MFIISQWVLGEEDKHLPGWSETVPLLKRLLYHQPKLCDAGLYVQGDGTVSVGEVF
jgi:hypothetical protein